MATPMLDLFLFHTNVEFDASCLACGVKGLVVDLERRGKETRQQGYPTQINTHFISDIKVVKRATGAYTICRIDCLNENTIHEVQRVIEAGADEILIPMVRTTAEVERVLRLADGRCKVSAMIETVEATAIADQFAGYPLTRIYVGLTDLWIERGTPHIFTSIGDGTVSQIRQQLPAVNFGFAGLTLPDCGRPLSCKHLINEMTMLNCGFSFLRRSFIADIQGLDRRKEITRLICAIENSAARDPYDMKKDHINALKMIDQLPKGPW